MIEQGADCEVAVFWTVGKSAGGCVRTEKKGPETGMGGTMPPGKVEIRTPQSRSQIVLDEWQCDRATHQIRHKDRIRAETRASEVGRGQ
jgi:hypothetical protein